MKKLFENHLGDMVRLFVNQIGVTIFAMMLYTAAGMITDGTAVDGLYLAISVFSVLFYWLLIFTVNNDLGAKDKIRVDSKKAPEEPIKGFLLGFFANLPNILFSLLAVLFAALKISDNEGVSGVLALLVMFLRLFASMYLGILNAIFSFLPKDGGLYDLLHSAGFAVMSMLSAGICALGYHFGRKNIVLFREKKK